MKTPHLGYTLFELIISLAITSILIVTGIPSLNVILANNKADNAYYQLFSLIQFARGQSVAYRQQVLICPTKDDENCSKDWGQKLMVFVDIDDNETFDNNDILLRHFDKADEKSKRLLHISGSKRYLRFKPDGSTGNQNGRLSYCSADSKKMYARQIIIYMTGRIRKADEDSALKKCS